MRRRRPFLATFAVALALSAFFAAGAAATFEATMGPRGASGRAAAPTFVVEAGGGRSTRVRDFEIEGGRCGSIFVALIEAGRVSSGFAGGHGAAVFRVDTTGLKLRLELRLKPRGEGLAGSGVFTAVGATCHERIPLDLVSKTIRGGGRHKPTA